MTGPVFLNEGGDSEWLINYPIPTIQDNCEESVDIS